MSLDFELYVECNSGGKELIHHSIIDLNITHNLNSMAGSAGIYDCLWRHEESDISKASDLIGPLTEGVDRLEADPEKFIAMNPANGWGTYDGLVSFAKELLEAATDNPDALIYASR